MDKTKLDRISELYRKSQTPEGLTADEKEEQRVLREEYLSIIRRNFRSTLESIEFVDEKKEN